MNWLEFYFFVAAACALAGYAFVEFRSIRQALLLTAAVLPAVFLALESTTAFMTIDAINDLFPETAFAASSDLKQFRAGSFRTSEMLLVPLAAALKPLAPDSHRLAMWLKGLHWMIGFICLLAIHRAGRFFVVSGKAPFFVAFFYAGLLLPTNALALKVFNYDKLSLMLTVLGVVWMARATEERRGHAAALGLVSLALAAQEKLIAAPILWLALPVFAFVRMQRRRSTSLWRDALISSLTAVAIVLAVHLAAYAVVVLTTGAALRLTTLFKPLLSVLWPLTRIEFGISRVERPITLLLACIGFTTAGALLLHVIAVLRAAVDSPPAWTVKVRPAVAGVFAAAVFITGVAWSCGGEIFLGPAAAVPGHLYQPGRTFNDLFWHYGASSLTAHLIYSAAAYLAVFVHCIPSVIWAMIFISCWIGCRPTPGAKDPIVSSYLLYLIWCLALLAPVFFALAQIPPGSRYFNLFIFLLVLVALLRIFSRPVRDRRKLMAAAVFAVLLVAEVAPFRPVYGAFAPIWAHETDKRFTASVQPGHLGSILRWTGWGEEVMLAGRRIENRCRPTGCGQIRLYWAYPGSWLAPTAIVPENISPIAGPRRPDYDDRAYFVVNRSAVVQQMVAFPRHVEPVDTICFRGYTQAWIFRGDDLKKAGFHF